MVCARCEHSQADHRTGRCVNATLAYVAAVGGTVTTVCRCKAFVEKAAPARVEASPQPTSESVAAPGEEGEAESEDEATPGEESTRRTRISRTNQRA